MTLWRVEWARLVRTRRVVVLLAVFAFFGAAGPVLAKYTPDIVKRAGGNITIIAPPPVPADGIANFVSNGLQIGLIVVIVVSAGALAVEARPGLAVFYRTRVRRRSDLVLPRYTVVTAATVCAYIVGALFAWYETAVLLGRLPAGRMVAGALLVCLYLVFAVAVVAAAATFVRGTLAVVGLTLGVLLGLPALAGLARVTQWVPSYLAGAQDGLVRGQLFGPYGRAAAITVRVTVALLALAVSRAGHAEH